VNDGGQLPAGALNSQSRPRALVRGQFKKRLLDQRHALGWRCRPTPSRQI